MGENAKHIAVMGGVVSIFDTPKYEQPYGIIECPTERDFNIATGLIKKYYADSVYILHGSCSMCGFPLEQGYYHYCPNCGRTIVDGKVIK